MEDKDKVVKFEPNKKESVANTIANAEIDFTDIESITNFLIEYAPYIQAMNFNIIFSADNILTNRTMLTYREDATEQTITEMLINNGQIAASLTEDIISLRNNNDDSSI